jgi:hypothetical protein
VQTGIVDRLDTDRASPGARGVGLLAFGLGGVREGIGIGANPDWGRRRHKSA